MLPPHPPPPVSFDFTLFFPHSPPPSSASLLPPPPPLFPDAFGPDHTEAVGFQQETDSDLLGGDGVQHPARPQLTRSPPVPRAFKPSPSSTSHIVISYPSRFFLPSPPTVLSGGRFWGAGAPQSLHAHMCI